MNKDISTKEQNGIAKAKEEFEQFLKTKEIKKPETHPTPAHTTQQELTKATVTLHCRSFPGKISIMEFEISSEKALLIRTTPVKNELAANDATPGDTPYSFTKEIECADDDPGCPHCQNPLKFFCDCGAISCHPEQNGRHTCPVCKNTCTTKHFTKPRPIAGSRTANHTEGKCGYGNTKRLPKQDNSLIKLK